MEAAATGPGYSVFQMALSRRELLIGAGSGVTLVVLAACTGDDPVPTPTPSTSLAVPKPARIVRSAWGTDPYTLGATTYVPVGGAPELRGIASAPLLARVFFGGEWRSSAPSTLRGALRSGRTAADEVADVASDGERVVVIGAGLAGARAAASLAVRGYDVVVIEARNRVGGRIESRDVDGDRVELGAWRLDSRVDAEIIRELGDQGIEVRPALPIGYRSPGKAWQDYAEAPGAPAALAMEAVAEASEWALTRQRDRDLASALDESGAAGRITDVDELDGAQVLEHFLQSLATSTGADATEQSAWFANETLGDVEGTDESVPHATLIPQGPLDAVVSALLHDRDVLLSTPVVGIDYADDGVSLRLATGESISADRVVVTVPLGVLKAGSIEFDPPLGPSRRSALNQLAVGDVEVVSVRFDEPFWSTDAVLWNLVGSDLPIVTWLNLTDITGEPELLGVVGGEAARLLSDLDDDELAREVRRSLEPFAG